MPTRNKQTRPKADKLVLLCVGGLIIGSVIPLIAMQAHTSTPKPLLLIMEVVGCAALAYVFSLYLLKK